VIIRVIICSLLTSAVELPGEECFENDDEAVRPTSTPDGGFVARFGRVLTVAIDEATLMEFVGRIVNARSGHVGNFAHVLGGSFAEADESDKRSGGVGTEAERFELLDGRRACLSVGPPDIGLSPVS
jgi:hypothetical protein